MIWIPIYSKQPQIVWLPGTSLAYRCSNECIAMSFCKQLEVQNIPFAMRSEREYNESKEFYENL